MIPLWEEIEWERPGKGNYCFPKLEANKVRRRDDLVHNFLPRFLSLTQSGSFFFVQQNINCCFCFRFISLSTTSSAGKGITCLLMKLFRTSPTTGMLPRILSFKKWLLHIYCKNNNNLKLSNGNCHRKNSWTSNGAVDWVVATAPKVQITWTNSILTILLLCQ